MRIKKSLLSEFAGDDLGPAVLKIDGGKAQNFAQANFKMSPLPLQILVRLLPAL